MLGTLMLSMAILSPSALPSHLVFHRILCFPNTRHYFGYIGWNGCHDPPCRQSFWVTSIYAARFFLIGISDMIRQVRLISQSISFRPM